MRLFLFTMAGLSVACLPGRRDGPAAGEILIEWRGAVRGTFRAPATASVCAETGLVELIAVRGDSGVAFLFFPADSSTLPAGEYRVVVPESPTETRPGVMAALKWYDRDNAFPFVGRHGVIRVEAAGQRTSGTVDAGFQLHEGSDTVRVAGRFVAVPLAQAATGCGMVSRRNFIG